MTAFYESVFQEIAVPCPIKKIFFSGLDDKVSRLEFELAASNELIIQLRNG